MFRHRVEHVRGQCGHTPNGHGVKRYCAAEHGRVAVVNPLVVYAQIVVSRRTRRRDGVCKHPAAVRLLTTAKEVPTHGCAWHEVAFGVVLLRCRW